MVERILIRPIGVVRNAAGSGTPNHDFLTMRSEIVLREELADALDGIEDYSHLVVLFWMDRVSSAARARKKIVPPYAPHAGLRGVFATRVPSRPNPIGMSIVPLVERRRHILVVEGLDAWDGTPVLDIKPYTGHSTERVGDFRIPGWEKRASR